MAIAADLQQAAGLAFDNLYAKWIGGLGVLTTAFQNFNNDVNAIFTSDGGDNSENERTVSNWLVIGFKIQATIPTAFIGNILPQDFFNQMVQYVYRICYAGFAANGSRITGAQATALLAAYNTRFG